VRIDRYLSCPRHPLPSTAVASTLVFLCPFTCSIPLNPSSSLSLLYPHALYL